VVKLHRDGIAADVLHALEFGAGALPFKNPEIVYLTGNVGRLGFQAASKHELLEGILQGVRMAAGPDVSVVVPTHSWSLVGSDTPFDRALTPSETGPLTELVRRQPGSVRQRHPFGSVTALGPLAERLCGKSTRHLYGPDTPYDRILKHDRVAGVSLGMQPHRAVTVVHHVEFTMGVPYRYTKEFLHPISEEGQVTVEPFYLYVTYRDMDIRRDRNARFFAAYEADGPIKQAPLNRSVAYGFDLVRFAATARAMMAEDIYAWLESPPEQRPFRQSSSELASQ
jgi:aminoglycoside 3-N-acetyltransferase